MTLDWITSGLDLGVFAILLVSSFAGSIISAVLGLGGGVLLLALMASLLPPAALIPVHGVVQLGSNAGRTFLMRPKIHWPPVLAFFIGSLSGAVFGGLLVTDLPPAVIRISIGLFILFSIVARPPAFLSKWPALTGAACSFLSMFVGATGPFVAVYVKALTLAREAHVATHALLMTFQHGLKVVVFAALGFEFGAWAGLMISLIIVGYAGTFIGKQVLTRIDDARFGVALNVMLGLLAARLIYTGVLGLI